MPDETGGTRVVETSIEQRRRALRATLAALGYVADPHDPDQWFYDTDPEHYLLVNVQALVARQAQTLS